MKLEIDASRQPIHDTSHDRLSVLRNAHCTLIALADGVDSSKSAQVAAALTVNELARCFRNGVLPEEPEDWAMILEAIDHVVLTDPDAGETSALVMLVRQGVVVGASVGDSVAYLAGAPGEPEEPHRLITPPARPGPPMGTGLAVPVALGPMKLEGKLVTRRAGRFAADGAAGAAVAKRGQGARGPCGAPVDLS